MSFYPSDKEDEAKLIQYLLTCSELSLSNIFIRRIDHDQKLKKDIADLIEKAIENMALVRLTELLRAHRAAIVEAIRERLRDSLR